MNLRRGKARGEEGQGLEGRNSLGEDEGEQGRWEEGRRGRWADGNGGKAPAGAGGTSYSACGGWFLEWYRFEVNKEILTCNEHYLSNATSLPLSLNS